jgi:translocation and assembly module TamA
MLNPRLTLVAALVWVAACAGVDKGQYGVTSLEIQGMEQMDEEAVKRCLLTTERETAEIPLGLAASECNEPPFDDSPPSVSLWRWPWTDWPLLNSAVVDVDRKRIERWYRARGFYEARVTDIQYEPKEATTLGADIAAGQCDPQKEECTVEVTMTVEEGVPILIGSVAVEGLEGLPFDTAELIEDAALPSLGARFDELDYDNGKQALQRQLAERSYAGAAIEGEVKLDHTTKVAHVRYRVTPGPAYRFGRVRIQGEGELTKSPIHAAAGIKSGTPYRESMLTEVQQEVYALGAFSVVEVKRILNSKTKLAHIHIKVTPLPYDAFRVGIGITSGALQRNESGIVDSVPQWDVHLLGRYERRHVFNTLGKLRIEDRPRLIFPHPFPETDCDAGETCPVLGNLVRVRLNQPGVVEARTDLIFETQWDYGPEPFLAFLRHDVMGRVSVKRAFLRRKVFGTFAVQHDELIVKPGEKYRTDEMVPGASEIPVAECGMPDPQMCAPIYEVKPDSYKYSFIEQDIRLDLRDNDVQPRKGIYLGVLTTQSVRAPISDWTMFRILPEARGYIPLPFHMVLALKFAVAANFIHAARRGLDPNNVELGPTSYRLRGGGAQSNRGYVAGELGAGIEGGLRRWESSAELRIRLGGAFGVVGFFDMGDVIRGSQLNFDHPNPSAGFGLRYLTIVGAIRFDMGFRLEPPTESDPNELFIFAVPGAMHLTLGEAF